MVSSPHKIACLASVSVGLFAGLKHVSLFERAKIGESVLRSPQFLRRQKTKNHLERVEKPAETTAAQATHKINLKSSL